ncbi:MAG: PHP domain-containing protein [Chloroflexota bacterium]|nr:PHP domain-containing protein [Chloroflexota bacterium]
MIIDLHVQTTKGPSDSSLTPQQLLMEAERVGLQGVCLTEHGGAWDRHEFERFAQSSPLALFRGMEINTDLGHLAVFGLDCYISGIHRARELRRAADSVGGFIIALHPFRRCFEGTSPRPTLPEAAHLPIFELVDEIEVANGACDSHENFFALQVAKKLGMRGTGGSDAHSTHGLGCCTTVFTRPIRTQEELLQELRAKRFYPAHGLLDGGLIPYGDGLTEVDLDLMSGV